MTPARTSAAGAVIALSLLSAAVGAQVYRCDEGGRTTYSAAPCTSGSATALPIQATPAPASEAPLAVARAVVDSCFEKWRRASPDPGDARMVGYVARYVPAGFPVLQVDAVFRNRAGGPDRTMLWCKLTPALALDEEATDRRVMEYRRERLGAR